MTITDYESGRTLRDVGLSLTTEEARELRAYLDRLLDEPTVTHAFLSEIGAQGLEKELTVRIDGPRSFVGQTRKPLPLPRRRNFNVA